MVGSGYIAVELAGILHGLGSEVTLVIRYDKVDCCSLHGRVRGCSLLVANLTYFVGFEKV